MKENKKRIRAQIIPAVLEKDFKEVEEKINICRGIFKLIQIDIGDNIFVKNKTWQNASDLKNFNVQMNFEVHLMVENPRLVVKKWFFKKIKRIIFHLEADKNPKQILKLIKQKGFQAGLAINPRTSLEKLKNIPPELLDEVLFMGVEPGFSGQKFEKSILKKIKSFHKMFPKVKIGVDGGVNPKTASLLEKSGANYLFVGSYFWKNLKKYPGQEKKKIKELVRLF
ncbi:MAG: ribulose-phosphate 3-epimerase [Patescibacteria group bacterium]|nr:ribulose-phosphate 3-epimerase [Patescibacteria group bacterium]MDD5164234.1 ribulose-phosphate 3-epimerase [Patescibacteria group bacterium]MDD5534652.1 ribulose-phosphate 3-epimerase [Patescibacteria group bacterium]